MNDLRARKELILAEADLHRQFLALERLQWERRGAEAHQFLDEKRWWILGGALAGGVILARGWHGWVKWLPTAIAMVRAFFG